MNSHRKALTICLAIMAASVIALRQMSQTQRLGEPGVKVVSQDVYTIVDQKKERIGTNMVALPEKALDYISTNRPIDKIVWEWLPKDTTYGHRFYVSPRDGFEVDNNVVLMGADRTSIHQPEYCLSGGGWQITDDRAVSIVVPGEHPTTIPVRKILATGTFKDRRGNEREFHGVYVFWFVSSTQSTSELKQAMWWMGRDVLATGVMQRWAYISYLAVCLPGMDEDAAYKRMERLIQAAAPQFVTQLNSAATDGRTAQR